MMAVHDVLSVMVDDEDAAVVIIAMMVDTGMSETTTTASSVCYTGALETTVTVDCRDERWLDIRHRIPDDVAGHSS